MPTSSISLRTRAVKSTKKSGSFHCPQCEAETQFHYCIARKFLMLSSIPLIPLGSLGEYVECTICQGTFVPRVLEYDPTANENVFQSEYEKAVRHSMVLMMLADGHIANKEMLVVQKIINKYGHADMSLEQLKLFVEQVSLQKEPMYTYLARVGPGLNDYGKEMLIKCALAVASADGHIDHNEEALITREMARILEMSNAHLRRVLLNAFEK